MATKEKTGITSETDQLEGKRSKLILFNDDFNSFDFVIDSLIEVCEHDPLQAETCAWITHYKGKCTIKNGAVIELKACFKEMSNRNLTVEIQ
ncbi:MAG: ATP-dependent Clp protease adaptor ClpS [Bacteroidetes bacterium]|nr:MAG: ATP-dependent Clp protease adaptor ClpS [Bacteroidota bacterium]